MIGLGVSSSSSGGGVPKQGGSFLLHGWMQSERLSELAVVSNKGCSLPSLAHWIETVLSCPERGSMSCNVN